MLKNFSCDTKVTSPLRSQKSMADATIATNDVMMAMTVKACDACTALSIQTHRTTNRNNDM
jgi:hypothetical protein